ncbi:MAG TPA: Coq4 family protein [Rhizomicrobium sp.]|jgi:ubiquinone biosynthesis protein COQ4|nr:Coq4 family protein [Rhizomicrobium sp.]
MQAQSVSNTRLRPFEAMRAVRKLIASPGDTSQVFVIFRAMRGRSGQRSFRRFVESPVGQAVLRERRDLFPLLTDREGLGRLPPGSLGRIYLDFVEAENLSAQGLVEASQEWDNDPQPADVELFRRRMRELHDVTHTVTGYGRDQLGELCLLTFMYRQQGNLGMLMIVAMAWSQVPREGRKAVREAWRNGKKARWLPGQDWEKLLAQPLDEIRRELCVEVPRLYQPMSR